MKRRLTRREIEALQDLDALCWEDSEAGGEGWADLPSFTELHGVSDGWAKQKLCYLVSYGLVESRPDSNNRKHYALTEAGADFLEPAATPTQPGDRK